MTEPAFFLAPASNWARMWKVDGRKMFDKPHTPVIPSNENLLESGRLPDPQTTRITKRIGR